MMAGRDCWDPVMQVRSGAVPSLQEMSILVHPYLHRGKVSPWRTFLPSFVPLDEFHSWMCGENHVVGRCESITSRIPHSLVID